MCRFAAIAVLLFATPASAETFGLVVGFNGSLDPELSPLKYADDDAIHNAALLRDLGARYVLAVAMDPDTRGMHPNIEADAPTKPTLFSAVERLNEMMPKNEANELFVFYSGHGDVKNGEGYVTLADGPLTRTDFRKLLDSSTADTIHVVVDACKSYFLVFDRGKTGIRRPTAAPLLLDADRPLGKNIGLLLSTSAAQDSHEWEQFQAGVFSHEVRSALRGAADINGDAQISYEEVGTFVFNANRSIANPRYRPKFFVQAPSTASALVTQRKRRRTVSGPWSQHHWYVEDKLGNRVIDFHPTRGQQLALLVPATGLLYLRNASKQEQFRIRSKQGSVSLASLRPQKTTANRRGAEHVAFRNLFKSPLGPHAVADYRANQAMSPGVSANIQHRDSWIRPALGISSAVLGAAGAAVIAAGSIDRRDIDESSSQTQRVDFNRRARNYRISSGVLLGAAAASFAGFAIWTWWPDEDVAVNVVSSGPENTGAQIRF